MPLDWSNLQKYLCPLCGSELKEKEDKHKCVDCNFSISDEKLSNMVVLRHRKLEPPEFIKELRGENKSVFSKLWTKLIN